MGGGIISLDEVSEKFASGPYLEWTLAKKCEYFFRSFLTLMHDSSLKTYQSH